MISYQSTRERSSPFTVTVFSKFYVEAGRKGEIDFTPGRHLTNTEIVKYMSLAAGEDVTSLYKQWKGFEIKPLRPY